MLTGHADNSHLCLTLTTTTRDSHCCLQMEGVRISGLFTPGRSFTGTDLRTYQVWAPAPEPARAAATARCLPPGAAVTVCADVGLASQPAATATMPLSLALASPSRAQVQAQLLQQALSQPFPQAMPQQQQHQQQQPQNPTQPQPPPAPTAQVPTHAYSPASEHGTRTLTLRTPLGHPLATLTVTPRMLEAVTVSQPLLQQLQAPPPAAVMAAVGAGGAAFTQIPPPSPAPAGAAAGPDAGVGALAGSVGGEEHHARALGSPSARFQPAPLLPAQHWASSMAAEEVCAGKMAADMCARAVDAVKKVLAGPAPDPQALDECQQAVLQVVDAVHVQTEQLQVRRAVQLMLMRRMHSMPPMWPTSPCRLRHACHPRRPCWRCRAPCPPVRPSPHALPLPPLKRATWPSAGWAMWLPWCTGVVSEHTKSTAATDALCHDHGMACCDVPIMCASPRIQPPLPPFPAPLRAPTLPLTPPPDAHKPSDDPSL